MQNIEDRISVIEDKARIYYLKEKDFAIIKLLMVLNKEDNEQLMSFVKARNNKAVEILFSRLVKKYAKKIRGVEITDNDKRIFAEGFNKSRKNLSNRVNMILDKT